MREYMLMVTEQPPAGATAAEIAAHTEARAAYERSLAEAGALLDAGRLRPSSEGKRVRRRGDQLLVEDGPFTDTMEAYAVLQATDLDAASALAARCPARAAETIEVRPHLKSHLVPDKGDLPGKIFGFLVLGNEASEASWTQAMDRIDAETSDKFPADGFLGGARLEAPSTGRRLEIDRSKRKLVDGPFLECKEVVGGVFFLRLPSLDDAVRWAGTSAFVRHGALEIRELWRT